MAAPKFNTQEYLIAALTAMVGSGLIFMANIALNMQKTLVSVDNKVGAQSVTIERVLKDVDDNKKKIELNTNFRYRCDK